MKNVKRIIALVLSFAMFVGFLPSSKVKANEADKVKIDSNVVNGSVYCNNSNPANDKDVYLSSIPKGGYELDSYYYLDDTVQVDLASNVVSHELYPATGSLVVGARFKEAEKLYLQPDTVKQLNRIAEILDMTNDEAEEFKLFIATVCNIKPNDFTNGYEFMFRLLEPLIYDYYDGKYLNIDIGNFNDVYFDNVTLNNVNKEYMKKIVGLYLYTYLVELRTLNDYSLSHFTYTDLHDAMAAFAFAINEGDDMSLQSTFKGVLNREIWLIISTTSILPTTKVNEAEEKASSIYRLLESLDNLQKYHDWDITWYKNDLDKFGEWQDVFIGRSIQGDDLSDDDYKKYFTLNDVVAVEAFDEWVNEKEHFDSFIEKTSTPSTYVGNLMNPFDDMPDDFEKTKAQWKLINKCALDLYALYDSVLYASNFGQINALLTYDLGDDIMDMASAIDTSRAGDLFNYNSTFTNFMTGYLTLLEDYYNKVASGGADVSSIATYYDNLRDELYRLNQPVPTTSSSKTYKASNTDKTAEKISGSGKKGSKRTITPLEGKKVGRVTVTDKDGNKVDVTLNEDGTYSFIQPASNVDVVVTYVNREITLNINSTEADVDGERSNLDVCPVIRNDRTMLPIRFVAENLGAKVTWDEKHPEIVVITKGDTKIEITLGSDIAKVNGKEYKLDSVAFAENDRTYLPVRFVSENLNAVVEWNESRPMEVKIYER